MTLKARKYKIPKVSLRYEHEYIAIQRETLGDPNAFGERAATWATTAFNVKMDLQPIKALSANKLKMFDQGLVEVSTHWGMAEQGADIKPRDKVVDIDANEFSVEEVSDWRSHQEVLLKITEENA